MPSSKKPSSRGEEHLVDWLRGRHPLLGDDAARLPSLRAPVVTVDSQIEGVHFLAGTDPSVLAHRLLAVNLSDIAASGARPRFAFLALNTPRNFDRQRFFRAFERMAKTYGVKLAGGDLSHHDTVTLTLTLIGEVPAGSRVPKRSSARPGDRLWLGGPLGEAAIGRQLVAQGAGLDGAKVVLPTLPRCHRQAARQAVRRFLLPEPQLALGRWLGSRRSAAIDVSDGFAKDLRRLATASKVGARITLAQITPPTATVALAKWLDLDLRELVFGGGEDYVLLFSLPDSNEPPARFCCRAAGDLTAGLQLTVNSPEGDYELPTTGWDHLLNHSG